MSDHDFQIPDEDTLLKGIVSHVKPNKRPWNQDSKAAIPDKKTTQPSLRGGFLSTTSSSKKDGKDKYENPNLLMTFIPPKIIQYPLELNDTCKHCNSIELDDTIKHYFGLSVCSNCRENYDEEYYKLVTKTTAKEEFLLTDEELNDKDRLPHMKKPNPHKSSWSDMHLYLLGNVRDFAIEKWGSLDGLYEEIERRHAAKHQRQEKKFKQKLTELRSKTRSAVLRKRTSSQPVLHRHTFNTNNNGDSSDGKKKCLDCGLEIEQEEI